MIKYVYAYKDKRLKFYQTPMILDIDHEHFTEGAIRGAIQLQGEERIKARDLSAYYLGQFDDVKGIFITETEPVKLFDVEDYLLDETEDKQDGTKEN